MEKAHYFLSKEKKTVNEVAFLVGYKNAKHFITAFKKQYSVLPGSLNKS
jgi:AraC-like DNA-binding protein